MTISIRISVPTFVSYPINTTILTFPTSGSGSKWHIPPLKSYNDTYYRYFEPIRVTDMGNIPPIPLASDQDDTDLLIDQDIATMTEEEIWAAIDAQFGKYANNDLYTDDWLTDLRKGWDDRLESFNSINHLKGIYTFQHSEKVTDFLHQNPILVYVLLKAHIVIVNYFGKNTTVRLKISRDPEAEAAYDQIFAYIKTDLSVMDAIGRLSQLDHDWYLKQPSSIRRIFNIIVT